MLSEARRRLAEAVAEQRVELIQADLREPLPLDQPVDAILSTATFHWLADHAALYRQLAAVLKPGGQLAAQYGGMGNVARVRAAIDAAWPLDDGWAGPWNFTSPEQARAYLADAGSWTSKPGSRTSRSRSRSARRWRRISRRWSSARIWSACQRSSGGAFVQRVAAGIDPPVLDYVRLNVVARRERGAAVRDQRQAATKQPLPELRARFSGRASRGRRRSSRRRSRRWSAESRGCVTVKPWPIRPST